MSFVVDGVWGNWTDWEQCNVTCGGGWQLRTRVCDDPKYGGAPCPGSDEDRQICNDFNCPGKTQLAMIFVSMS